MNDHGGERHAYVIQPALALGLLVLNLVLLGQPFFEQLALLELELEEGEEDLVFYLLQLLDRSVVQPL